DAAEKPGARRRIPGDGSGADRDQIAYAAAAACIIGAGGARSARRADAPVACLRTDEACRTTPRRTAAGWTRLRAGAGMDRTSSRAGASQHQHRGLAPGVAVAAAARERQQAPSRDARRVVGTRTH